ncbi:MAG TPA: BON domain-containing protein [Thermoanaerobaculia bacterium]|nr:BON domain-containing protein [Thermoanaerobaculia bacterium]
MRFSKTLAMVALLGVVLLGASAANAADNQADWTVKLKVKLALLNKLGTDSMRVEVDSNAGALTLTGTVEKRETRELAESVAKSVDGVDSVQNDVLLEASVADPNKAGVAVGEAEAEVKDAVLATRVRLALIRKLGADGFKISTVAANGVVTLRFGEDFAADRRAVATKTAKSVTGVRTILAFHKA